MYKWIPNFLTMMNLFFGCMAIVHIMGVHPKFVVEQEQAFVIQGMEDLYWGAIFIGLAAVMDMLDGLAARLLRVHSPIGGDLDSLADLVSFGVAPAMILYQLLWRAYMMEPGALQTPTLVLLPAFLIPIAGAYRLARFNNAAPSYTNTFRGMPIPAVGLLVASFPLVLFYNYNGIGHWLEHRWLLYIMIGLLSYLMIATFPFMKWSHKNRGFLFQIIIVLATAIGAFFFNFGGILVGFLAYMIISLFFVREKKDI